MVFPVLPLKALPVQDLGGRDGDGRRADLVGRWALPGERPAVPRRVQRQRC